MVVMAAVFAVAFVALTRHLLALVAKATKQGNEKTAAREARLNQLYGNLESLMDAFESYVGKVRRDLEKERASLEELSRQARAGIARTAAPPPDIQTRPQPVSIRQNPPAGAIPIAARPPAPKPQKATPLPQRGIVELGPYSTKPQRARFLIDRGFSPQDVARELGIGTGEVKLITGLEISV